MVCSGCGWGCSVLPNIEENAALAPSIPIPNPNPEVILSKKLLLDGCWLLISFFLGDYILLFFGISIPALKIGGGLIIASSGFSLLSGDFRKHKGMKNKFVKADVAQREDIAITPLALPMIADPGTISLLISYKQEVSTLSEQLTILAAVVAVSFLVYLVLRTAHPISKKLGASGINALSRIIGFIVITIGVEFIISAVEFLIPNLLS